jgi:hypothetical protein
VQEKYGSTKILNTEYLNENNWPELNEEKPTVGTKSLDTTPIPAILAVGCEEC